MSERPRDAPEIAYATPAVRPPARTFAATMLMLSGLALILLGGCFMIGVWMTMEHTSLNGNNYPLQPTTPGEIVFLCVLTVLACASFGGAITLLIIGTRALLRVT